MGERKERYLNNIVGHVKKKREKKVCWDGTSRILNMLIPLPNRIWSFGSRILTRISGTGFSGIFWDGSVGIRSGRGETGKKSQP